MKKPAVLADPCPCGHELSYADCCGRWHAGAAAPDAPTLMRSRYSAYVRGLTEYLSATWHISTRPAQLTLTDIAETRWLGLDIRGGHTQDLDHAVVEFVARYRVGGASAQRLHEISRFVREDGRWYYLDGDIRE